MRILCALAVLGLASPFGYTTPAPYDYSNQRPLREKASECAELRELMVAGDLERLAASGVKMPGSR